MLGPLYVAVLARFTIGAPGGGDTRKFSGGAEEAGRLSWVGEVSGGAGGAEASATVADKAGVAIQAIVEASSSSRGELSRGARQTIIKHLVKVRAGETLRRVKCEWVRVVLGEARWKRNAECSCHIHNALVHSHLLAVTGTRIRVATRRAVGTPANVGRPRYCISILWTELTLVV